jgi:hypothetical protein
MESKTYSAFPALAAVLIAFVLSFSVEVYAGLRLRAQINAQHAAMARILPEAQKINTSMHGLSRDLIALASTSPGARKIVQDFKIQAVPKSAPAPAAKPPAP